MGRATNLKDRVAPSCSHATLLACNEPEDSVDSVNAMRRPQGRRLQESVARLRAVAASLWDAQRTSKTAPPQTCSHATLLACNEPEDSVDSVNPMCRPQGRRLQESVARLRAVAAPLWDAQRTSKTAPPQTCSHATLLACNEPEETAVTVRGKYRAPALQRGGRASSMKAPTIPLRQSAQSVDPSQWPNRHFVSRDSTELQSKTNFVSPFHAYTPKR
jgi:hypothetical protein